MFETVLNTALYDTISIETILSNSKCIAQIQYSEDVVVNTGPWKPVGGGDCQIQYFTNLKK